MLEVPRKVARFMRQNNKGSFDREYAQTILLIIFVLSTAVAIVSHAEPFAWLSCISGIFFGVFLFLDMVE